MPGLRQLTAASLSATECERGDVLDSLDATKRPPRRGTLCRWDPRDLSLVGIGGNGQGHGWTACHMDTLGLVEGRE